MEPTSPPNYFNEIRKVYLDTIKNDLKTAKSYLQSASKYLSNVRSNMLTRKVYPITPQGPESPLKYNQFINKLDRLKKLPTVSPDRVNDLKSDLKNLDPDLDPILYQQWIMDISQLKTLFPPDPLLYERIQEGLQGLGALLVKRAEACKSKEELIQAIPDLKRKAKNIGLDLVQFDQTLENLKNRFDHAPPNTLIESASRSTDVFKRHFPPASH